MAFNNVPAEKLASYRLNKKIGGANFAKGHSFENSFAIVCIARGLERSLRDGTTSKVTAQHESYLVDDLVIEFSDERHSCWQLKNSKSVGWGDGNTGSLAFDFGQQLTESDGKVEQIGLVCSDNKIVEKLIGGKPAGFDQVEVSCFPDEKWDKLVNNELIRQQLVAIAKSSNPTNDLIIQIATCICGLWVNSGFNLNIPDFIKEPLTRLLRVPGAENAVILRAGVTNVLNAIDNFEYGIDRGFFFYEYLGTRQTLNFAIDTPRFDTVQNWIESEKPAEFEGDFEDMLLTWSN